MIRPRLILTFLALAAAAALVLAAAALAKGPDRATVSGPGLAEPLVIQGLGEPGGVSPLGRLVTAAGFFPAAFGQTPSPMLAARPAGALGPRYLITYRVPGNRGLVIRQVVFPYAKPVPVTWMRPGQRIYDIRTPGGWFRGTRDLKRVLVAAGLPPRAPAGRG
jgi:hypothetical protein